MRGWAKVITVMMVAVTVTHIMEMLSMFLLPELLTRKNETQKKSFLLYFELPNCPVVVRFVHLSPADMKIVLCMSVVEMAVWLPCL